MNQKAGAKAPTVNINQIRGVPCVDSTVGTALRGLMELLQSFLSLEPAVNEKAVHLPHSFAPTSDATARLSFLRICSSLSTWAMTEADSSLISTVNVRSIFG